MKKTNNYIKENLNKIISVFILMSPILDLLVSISINVFHHNLNIGIIFRMLFLLFIYYVSVILYHKKKNLIYIFLCLIYLCVYLFIQFDNTLMSNLHGFMRTFYFPILLLGIFSIHDEIKIERRVLLGTVFTYILLIFIPVITKTGFDSYSVAKIGSTGWYNSTNEISGIISIILPFIFIELMKKEKIIIKTLLAILFLYVISEMGTKTPILSLFIVIIMTTIYLLVKVIKNKNYKALTIILLTITTLSIASVIVVPKTNFYKNIKIHAKYLKLNSVKDIFTSEYVFDHFIFSQRISFYEKAAERYEKTTPSKKVFGMGYTSKANKNYKEIEIDYYDIWYNHGLIGFILFFSVYFYVLYYVFKNIPKKIEYDNYMKYTSLFLILVLSLFSGHIITTPAVSLFSVIILIDLVNVKECKKIKKKNISI